MASMSPDPGASPGARNAPSPGGPPSRVWRDAAIGLALFLLVAAVWVIDHRRATAPPPPPPQDEPPPPPPVITSPEDLLPPVDRTRRVLIQCSPDGRFGLVTTGAGGGARKKLTFSETGQTNNTRLWVDGETPLVGSGAGQMIRAVAQVAEDRIEMVWQVRDIRVTQILQYVPGALSRRMDTVRVTYQLTNTGAGQRTVGLRVMLDSLIGSNDGVPFIVPGRRELVTSPQSYRGTAIPDFVRALEIPDLANPGVIADLGLRVEGGEKPEEVVLTHWPGSNAAWQYDRTRAFGRDTAIGVYYARRPLAPGETREIQFTYGLGTLSSLQTQNVALGLTAGGPFHSGGKFWMVALVGNPQVGQRVRLVLPSGLSFAPGHSPSKPVPIGAEYAQVSWLVAIDPTRVGPAEIRAQLEPDGVQERYTLTIEPRDPSLTLIARGPFRQGKPFWMVALVRDARPGQAVELELPSGFTLAEGYPPRQAVRPGAGYRQVNWLVQAPSRAEGPVDFRVRLLPDRIQQWTTVEIHAGTIIE